MKEVSAQEAWDLLQSDPSYIYLDVRSVEEFQAGHPKNAINIPLLHLQPGVGMTPNPDFSAVVDASLPKDARLVIGCKSGGRSARACDILSGMGYTNVANVRGGFVGAMDNAGRLIEPGWSMLDLPICSRCNADAEYETLAARTRK